MNVRHLANFDSEGRPPWARAVVSGHLLALYVQSSWARSFPLPSLWVGWGGKGVVDLFTQADPRNSLAPVWSLLRLW